MRNLKALVIVSALALPFTAFAAPDQKPATPATPAAPATPAPAQATPATPAAPAGAKLSKHKVSRKAPKKPAAVKGS